MLVRSVRHVCLHVWLVAGLTLQLWSRLVSGTCTWLVMAVRLLSFVMVLLLPLVRIMAYWALDHRVIKNIEYGSGEMDRNLLDVYLPPDMYAAAPSHKRQQQQQQQHHQQQQQQQQQRQSPQIPNDDADQASSVGRIWFRVRHAVTSVRRRVPSLSHVEPELPVAPGQTSRQDEEVGTTSDDDHSEPDNATSGDAGRPVLVFFSGGAWIIGYKAWCCWLGRSVSRAGAVLVAPDYRNFPQGTIASMIDDARNAVTWVIKNANRFGADPRKVVLVGQSAGAHIVLMLLADQIERQARGECLPWSLKDIRGIMAVSAPSDLMRLTDHFHQRGLDASIVRSIMRNDVKRYSPTHVFSSAALKSAIRQLKERQHDDNCHQQEEQPHQQQSRRHHGHHHRHHHQHHNHHRHGHKHHHNRDRNNDGSALDGEEQQGEQRSDGTDQQQDSVSPLPDRVPLIAPGSMDCAVHGVPEAAVARRHTTRFPTITRRYHSPSSGPCVTPFPAVAILHGDKDRSVPFELSESMFDCLANTDWPAPISLAVYHGWSHTDPILEGPFSGDNTLAAHVIGLARQMTTEPSACWSGTAEPPVVVERTRLRAAESNDVDAAEPTKTDPQLEECSCPHLHMNASESLVRVPGVACPPICWDIFIRVARWVNPF